MDKIKLVAILRGIQPAEAADHIETLINAGFRYIEIPLNSPDWQQSIPAMVRQFGERAMIGAGTVLKVEQVDFLAEAGAKLIVTPNTAPAVIRRAVDKGMLVCAGCATASEAFSALDAGGLYHPKHCSPFLRLHCCDLKSRDHDLFPPILVSPKNEADY